MKAFFDLVSHTPELGQNVFICSSHFGGIVEPNVETVFDLPDKDRTRFLRIVADGDDVIELIPQKVINALRTAPRDIETKLLHHGNGFRMNFTRRKCAGRINFNILVEGFQEAFRHLAATGIAGTQDENCTGHRYPISHNG